MSLQAQLARIVEAAGYIKKTNEHSVEFKVEGVRHHFETFGNDTEYARLIVTFMLPPLASVSALYMKANEQNEKSKAVKTVIYPEAANPYVAFSIEMFFDDVATWEPVFERSMAALRGTSDTFFEAVRGLEAIDA